MASTSPPPPPAGKGNGAFIAAALVMVVLIAALLFWKCNSGKAEAPVVESTQEPERNTLPKMAEPPPPPPPPEEAPDAGSEAEAPKKAAVRSGPSGCAGPCSGDSAAVQGALAARARQAQGCYERALRQNAMLEGQIRVSVRVAPSGAVCNASIAADQLGDPSVSSCILQRFRASSFPPPNGGCMDAQVPINFKAKR